MNVLIDSFLDYLRYERNYSEYTINAYFKDLQQFEDFVKEKKEGIFVPEEVDTDIVRNWIISLLDNKISPVSVNRKLSSLKSFFNFLMKKMSKGGGMMGIGKSNAKMYMEKQTGVTFLDVAGEDEAKES